MPGTEFTLLVMPCKPPYMAGRSLIHITPRAPPHPLKHSTLLPPFAWDAKPSQLGMVNFRSILTSNITSSGWPSLTHPKQLPQLSLSLLSIPLPSYISSEHLLPSEIILFIYLSTCLCHTEGTCIRRASPASVTVEFLVPKQFAAESMVD